MCRRYRSPRTCAPSADGIVRDSPLAGPPGLMVGDATIPIWRGAMVVAVWIVAFVAAVFWRFQRGDAEG